MFQWLKNILKCFIPPSANTFHSFVLDWEANVREETTLAHTQEKRIEGLEKLVLEQDVQFQALLAQVSALEEYTHKLEESNVSLSQSINALASQAKACGADANGRFDTVETGLRALENHFDAAKNDIQARLIQALVEKTGILTNHLQSIKAMSDDQITQTRDHGQKMVDMNGRLQSVWNQVNYMLGEKHLYWAIANAISAAVIHPVTFAGYRNKYAGQDVVLCGSGATLNFYEPKEGAVHVAINLAIRQKKVRFDYIFSMDYRGVRAGKDEVTEYAPDHCIKFFGYQGGYPDSEFPESFVTQCKAKRFVIDRDKTDMDFRSGFALDLEHEPFYNGWTSAMQALQFILYTNPRRIYLAGIDMAGYHFYEVGHEGEEGTQSIEQMWFSPNGVLDSGMLQQFQMFKDFAAIHYPETEIISINPVRLKGLFRDEFTDSYLEVVRTTVRRKVEEVGETT